MRKEWVLLSLAVILGQGNQRHWMANQDFPLDVENCHSGVRCLRGTVVHWAGAGHLGPGGPGQVTQLSSLSFHFPICKMGTPSPSQGPCED